MNSTVGSCDLPPFGTDTTGKPRTFPSRLAFAACLVAGLIASSGSPAGAATYYVDRLSPTCSNSGAGTEAQPYCTISAAVNARGGPGTTIIVKPGVYPEQVTITTSGISGSPLVLRASAGGVILDGTDDFAATSRWVQVSGDVWLASTVSWYPTQVFLDGTRIDSSTVAPASLPSRTFRWVLGSGLYVNAGGGNPGDHQAGVGRRNYGFSLFARSWITIEGFTVTRTQDRGIYVSGSCTNVALTHNTVNFTGKMGIQVVGGSGILIGSNTVHDCRDHGIALINGVTASTLEDNESFRNAHPIDRIANGIYLFGCPGNVLRRNRVHDNQDTGLHIQSGSNNCVQYLNRSWNNGDHGYDHLQSTGTIHNCDVAYGNFRDGFSIEGAATGTQIHNCIAVDNGLTTSEFNLWVDSGSATGFVSNHNIIWNSTSQPPVKYVLFTPYSSVAAYSAASGQDAQSLEADPRFVNAAVGDFHLLAGSPAIDNGNSGSPNWPSLDADGLPRFNDAPTSDTGVGPVTFSDRGAHEFSVITLPTTPCGIANLVGNPSFETNTQNWKGIGCTIALVPGGSAGSFACRATSPASRASFTIEDSPNWIAATTAGASYRFRAWVRSDSSRGLARIKVREYVNRVRVGETSSPEVTLSPTWQLLETDYVALQAGSTIDMTVRDAPVDTSESFDIDDISICPLPVPPAPGLHAALRVTPAAGNPPLLVTADASGSTDVGGTIVSYLFDFGDGNVVGPQPEATASHTYAAGSWTAKVNVTDNLGATDSATVSVRVLAPCGANLVGNPSFENSTEGWKGVACTITRVPGGSAGSFACRATGPPILTSFTVADNPNWIVTTTAGTVYHFRAWVRSDNSRGLAKIKVREYLNGSRVGEASSPEVTLSPTWQLLEAEYVAVQTGSTIDLAVRDAPVALSENFDVDDVSACAGGVAPSARAMLADEADADEAAADVTAPEASAQAFVAPIVSPNPMGRQGTLRFSTRRAGPLSVAVYDVVGRRVRTVLDDANSPAGLHVIALDDRGDDGTGLNSGVYFYRVRSLDGFKQGRFLIMK